MSFCGQFAGKAIQITPWLLGLGEEFNKAFEKISPLPRVGDWGVERGG
jgi:hypothetical protein